jgi:hypothetical protein
MGIYQYSSKPRQFSDPVPDPEKAFFIQDFIGRKAVKPQQPIRLIQPVLSGQRRRGNGPGSAAS